MINDSKKELIEKDKDCLNNTSSWQSNFNTTGIEIIQTIFPLNECVIDNNNKRDQLYYDMFVKGSNTTNLKYEDTSLLSIDHMSKNKFVSDSKLENDFRFRMMDYNYNDKNRKTKTRSNRLEDHKEQEAYNIKSKRYRRNDINYNNNYKEYIDNLEINKKKCSYHMNDNKSGNKNTKFADSTTRNKKIITKIDYNTKNTSNANITSNADNVKDDNNSNIKSQFKDIITKTMDNLNINDKILNNCNLKEQLHNPTKLVLLEDDFKTIPLGYGNKKYVNDNNAALKGMCYSYNNTYVNKTDKHRRLSKSIRLHKASAHKTNGYYKSKFNEMKLTYKYLKKSINAEDNSRNNFHGENILTNNKDNYNISNFYYTDLIISSFPNSNYLSNINNNNRCEISIEDTYEIPFNKNTFYINFLINFNLKNTKNSNNVDRIATKSSTNPIDFENTEEPKYGPYNGFTVYWLLAEILLLPPSESEINTKLKSRINFFKNIIIIDSESNIRYKPNEFFIKGEKEFNSNVEILSLEKQRKAKTLKHLSKDFFINSSLILNPNETAFDNCYFNSIKNKEKLIEPINENFQHNNPYFKYEKNKFDDNELKTRMISRIKYLSYINKEYYRNLKDLAILTNVNELKNDYEEIHQLSI